MIALAVEAASAVPTKVVGISANGWITALVGLIASVIGTGGVYGIFKGLALLHEQRNNRAKDQEDAATVVRREMLEMNERQQKRIDALENMGREDRKRFDDEVVSLRKAHAEEVAEMRLRYEAEIRSLRDEIAGYHRQLVQFQRTSGMAAHIGGKAPTSAMKRVEDTGLGDILRSLDVPDDAAGG